MPPCLAVPCGNSRGKNPSIISIPHAFRFPVQRTTTPLALRISKSHPWVRIFSGNEKCDECEYDVRCFCHNGRQVMKFEPALAPSVNMAK